MRVVAPGQSFEASADTGVTGLIGQLGVQILDTPSDTVITARTTSGIAEAPAGSGLYTATLAAPFVEGTYSIVWDHHGIFAREELEVAFSGVITIPTGGDLITLAEFKVSQGIDVLDTRADARDTQWIGFVSDAIRAYTERDFGLPIITETRTFEYDGSGYLDIDDAADITAVSFTYPLAADIVIPSTDWSPKPQRRDDAPVYYYVLMGGYYGMNPEMGFTRNLDVWVAERGYAPPPIIKVAGTWGWPFIPGAVKMAAMLTMQEWIERPSGEGLTSEAIEGWSRSWGGKGNSSTAAIAIPQRARDLLAPYDKGI